MFSAIEQKNSKSQKNISLDIIELEPYFFALGHRQYSATLIRLPIRSNVNSILKKILFILIFMKKK